MNATELESMVVRLLGDGSQYQRMMQEAQDSTNAGAKAVEAAGTRIEAVKKSLEGFGAAAAGALGVLGISTSLKSAFESFDNMEKGMLKLDAAIRMNGGDAKELSGRYYELATRMAEVTTLSKGDVMSLAREAETMGQTGEAAERLMRNAIALSGATDQSTHSSLMMLMAMERGNMQMLRRIPALRGIRNETEMLAKVNQLMKSGWEQQIAVANTTGGRLERLSKFVSNLKKQVGEMVEYAIRPAVLWLTKAVEWFKSLDKFTQKAAITVILLVGAFVAAGPAIQAVSYLIGPLTSSFTLLTSAMRVMGISATTMFGPWGIIIAGAILLIIGAVAMVVDHLGGWEKTWKAVQKGASDLWDWLQPVFLKIKEVGVAAWLAISSVVSVVWATVKSAVGAAWTYIQSVFSSFGMSWEDMKTIATRALQIISTAIAVAMVPFTGGLSLLFAWTSSLEDIRDRFLMVAYAVQNFEVVANLAWAAIKLGFMTMVASIETFFTGQVPSWLQSFQDDFDTQLDAVQKDFDKFKKNALGANAADNKKAADAGAALGANFNKGLKGEHGKLEAVLAGSAEAVSRMAAFQDRLREPHGAAPMTPEGRVAATIAAAGAAVNTMQRQNSDLAGNLWSQVTGMAQRAWDAAVAYAMMTWENITFLATHAWEIVQQLASDTWNSISGWAQESWENFDAWMGAAIAQFTEDFFFIWDNFPAIAEAMWNDLTAQGTQLWDDVSSWAQSTWANVTETATFFWNNLPAIAQATWDNVSASASTFFSTTLPEYASAAWDRVVEIARTVLSNITGGSIATSVQNFGQQLQERISPQALTPQDNGRQTDLLGRAVDFLGQMAGNVFNLEVAGF